MSAFTRTQADGTWITGYAVTPADMEDLDTKIYHAVNGDRGGTYCPTSVLEITSASMRLSGDVTVVQGGKISNGVISLYGTQYELLAPGHANTSRTLWQPCVPFAVVGPRPWAVAPSLNPHGAQAVAAGISTSQGVVVPAFTIELRVHDGATLSQARLRLRVPTPHPHVPTSMPKVRIGRLRYDGLVEYLTDTIAGDGYTELTKAKSGSAWHNDGKTQEYTILCDQNNVIDVSQYSYFAEIVEETGGRGFPFQISFYEGATIDACDSTNVSITVNPHTTGDVALLRGQTDKRENGIRSGNFGGALNRAGGMDTAVGFSNGLIFYVGDVGSDSDYTLWQMTVPEPYALDQSAVLFDPIQPRGTLFLGMFLDFTAIADNRFQ